MITLLLIVRNQEKCLKQHLHGYDTLLKKFKGSILIVDDGSTDNTQNYIETHFNHIVYCRNPFESGYQHCFNQAIKLITTRYVLVMDPHITCHQLSLKDCIETMIAQQLWLLSLPIKHSNSSKQYTSFYWNDLQLQLHHSAKTNKLSINEAMIIDTQRLPQLNQLNVMFYSPKYAWFDLAFKGVQLGQQAAYFHMCLLQKNLTEPSFFSYQENNESNLKDSLLFQWLNCKGFGYTYLRWSWICKTCFTFKPKQLFNFLEVCLKWFWHKKPKKPKWIVLKDTDILQYR